MKRRFTEAQIVGFLLRLLPRLTELRRFDNSAEADPAAGHRPEPLLVLHATRGRIAERCPPADVPGWAKPIAAAALRRQRREAAAATRAGRGGVPSSARATSWLTSSP